MSVIGQHVNLMMQRCERVTSLASVTSLQYAPALHDDVIENGVEAEDDEDGDEDVVDRADMADLQQLPETRQTRYVTTTSLLRHYYVTILQCSENDHNYTPGQTHAAVEINNCYKCNI